MKNIKNVLENLKQKGFSPYERAIVFSYWTKFSVYYVSSEPLHHVRQEQLEISARIQNILENAPNREWVTDVNGLRKEIQSILIRKDSEVKFKDVDAYVKQNMKHIHVISDRLMASSFKNFTAGITREFLGGVQELSPQLSEGDFEKWCAKDLTKVSHECCVHAHRNLKVALERANIPMCVLNAVVYENKTLCQKLADSINEVCRIFEEFNVKGFALNTIDLHVISNENDDAFGHMSSRVQTVDRKGSSPVVKLYCTKNEWARTLIHEYLHAHDFLLGDLIEKETDMSKLDPSRHPLVKSWHKVQNRIAQLAYTQVSTEKISEMSDNIAKRWSAIGLDQAYLEQCITQWRQSTHPKKDYQCIKRLEKIIEESSVKKSPPFFARVVLSQYQALENMQTEPFYKFAMEFEQTCNRIEQQQPLWDKIVSRAKIFFIRNSEMYTVDCSDKKYFADIAEQLARSMEVLVKNEEKMDFAVYPSENLSSSIEKIWRTFFTSRHVQGAYEVVRQKSQQSVKPSQTNNI